MGRFIGIKWIEMVLKNVVFDTCRYIWLGFPLLWRVWAKLTYIFAGHVMAFYDTLKYCKFHHGRLFCTWDRHGFPQAKPTGVQEGSTAGTLSMGRCFHIWLGFPVLWRV